MKTYVGIDLGTTNSAICTYSDGKTKIWSYDQNSVYTPSAIYINKKGRRVFGISAYNNYYRDPENAAILFKRFLGTTEIFRFRDTGFEMTPEECSAEILKLLYSYIPEDVKNEVEGIVITVPAAFNQMKKNATYDAAKRAGFANTLLLQEPVAAIMSIMKNTDQKGNFIVYDLGGGTFDVSVAANIGNTVNLLANGGIEMCGGRDIDRMIFNEIIVPWLKNEFVLPDSFNSDSDFLADEYYRKTVSLSMHCIEEAKKILDKNPTANITLNEFELGLKDQEETEMYIDTEISQEQVNGLLDTIIEDTVRVTKETVAKAGVNLDNIENIVFIGGPTNYKPLRDLVSEALGIRQNNDINPMTAVCEGAAVFAETIDWNQDGFVIKASREEKTTDIGLKLIYDQRTCESKARIACVLEKEFEEYTIEINDQNTGWTTGQLKLVNKQIIYLPLQNTVNRFRVTVWDMFSKAIDIGNDIIEVTKTAASIGAITAPKTLSIAYKIKSGGQARLDPIVMSGDALPLKIQKTYRAGESIHSGSGESLNLQIWEGENFESPEDNTPVGTLRISGNDFLDGMINVGDEIKCTINISVGGDLSISVSASSIGMEKKDDFYTRTSDCYDTDNPEALCTEANGLLKQIESMQLNIYSDEMDDIFVKAKKVVSLENKQNCGKDDILKGYGIIDEIKKVLGKIAKANKKQLRQYKLNINTRHFNNDLRDYATEEDIEEFRQITKMAQRAIDRNEDDFEDLLEQLYYINGNVYFAHDHFIIKEFNYLSDLPLGNYYNKNLAKDLISRGKEYKKNDQIEDLKEIVFRLRGNKKETRETSVTGSVNITK